MGNIVVVSILSMSGLGLFFASILALAHKKLRVVEDPRIAKIENFLPGVNCGACGFASCHQYAEMLAKGEATPTACKAGGEEVDHVLSKILGVEIQTKTKELAIVHCGADFSKRKKKALYVGIKTCLAAHNMSGGENLCEYGCLGYGDCTGACPFGAITMVNGLPKVDKNKCTACKKCIASCPRNIISVEKIGAGEFIYVACNSLDKGAETRKICSVGCIACSICQKMTNNIFYVENNLSHVHYDKMQDIGNKNEVQNKCPTKCIVSI